MGMALAAAPLIGAVLPIAMSAFGFGPKPPKPQAAPTAAQMFQAPAPPKTPTLADANVARARAASSQSSIRSSTVRTSPEGLLGDATTTSGSLLG